MKIWFPAKSEYVYSSVKASSVESSLVSSIRQRWQDFDHNRRIAFGPACFSLFMERTDVGVDFMADWKTYFVIAHVDITGASFVSNQVFQVSKKSYLHQNFMLQTYELSDLKHRV